VQIEPESVNIELETVQIEPESAQIECETVQIGSESAQIGSESARIESETAQIETLTVRGKTRENIFIGGALWRKEKTGIPIPGLNNFTWQKPGKGYSRRADRAGAYPRITSPNW
jgi:hypothetical protein